ELVGRPRSTWCFRSMRFRGSAFSFVAFGRCIGRIAFSRVSTHLFLALDAPGVFSNVGGDSTGWRRSGFAVLAAAFQFYELAGNRSNRVPGGAPPLDRGVSRVESQLAFRPF